MKKAEGVTLGFLLGEKAVSEHFRSKVSQARTLTTSQHHMTAVWPALELVDCIGQA